MTNKKQFHSAGFWQLALFMGTLSCFLISPMYVSAGSSGYEGTDTQDLNQTSEVTVTLRGANRPGVVRIVDYLLRSFPEVVKKTEGELHVVPGNKSKCVASWLLTVNGINGIDVESKLIATINSLDLKTSNDIFYESPFIIVAQDLEMVKQINGRNASEKDAVFSLLSEDLESFTVTHPKEYSHTGNPWLLISGAGFE